jgi:sec-independent protein translocase protein TatB
MFDFAWSEIGMIAAVALVLIGPKDLPVAVRTITDVIKKARRMASEFQGHVDEMMRDADLGDVREQISSLRNFDIRGELERHIDPDHTLRDTFASNPLEPEASPLTTDGSAVAQAEAVAHAHDAVAELEPPAEPDEPAAATPSSAPAFIPPALVQPPTATGAEADAPAFIPPQVVLQRSARPPA